MCITPYLAQFSCHDPHPTPSGTARAANFPDLRARRSIWPKICLPSSASQAHFSLVLSQSPARGAHRSQVTLIEMGAFGSPTRMLVRHQHHTGEQRQVNDLQQPARKIVPHDDSRISERHHHFSLCVFLLALLLPRAAVPGAGARPPRRAALALLPLVPRTRTTPPPFETLPRQHARTTDERTMRRVVRRSG